MGRPAVFRKIVALGVMLAGIVQFCLNGPGWFLGVWGFVALLVLAPGVFVIPMIFSIVFVMRPVIRVTVNDEGLSSNHLSIPWSSFSRFGTMSEFGKYFILESGRGTFVIPKRAFQGEAEIAEFRQMMNEKGKPFPSDKQD